MKQKTKECVNCGATSRALGTVKLDDGVCLECCRIVDVNAFKSSGAAAGQVRQVLSPAVLDLFRWDE